MLRLSRFVLFVGAASLLSAGPPEGSDPSVARAKAALAQLPLRFEANQGQMSPAVRYSAHGGGYDLFLTERGPSLAFATAGRPGSGGQAGKHGVPARVDISLLNSNRAPEIEALDRTAARTDFFRGNQANWRANVPSYRRVRYRAVYPGVDVVYYGNQNQLEYDFVLQPGADPNAIRMKFSGAGHLSLSPEGDLVLESGDARIVQKKPFIYQEDPGSAVRHQVAGRYALLGHNVVGLRLDHYDRTRTLVVDPTLTYLTYLGGVGTDQINAVKLGPKGLLYIAAQTDTNAFPGPDGAYSSSNTGLTDIWVAVLDTRNGYGLVYASYLGGTNLDIPLAMDVDLAGVVYLTGTTTSTNFPVTGNALQATGAGATIEAFVVKLDLSLTGTDSLVYSSYLGGLTGNDSGNGIAVDAKGMIYIIGTTKSSDFPVTSGAYAPVIWGTQDTFLCEIDPNAPAMVYSTYLGGEGLDYGKSILVGSNGLVYFASSTLSALFPMAGYNYSVTPFGAQDIIIGVMDMTKSGVDSLVYATYFGGSGNDEVNKIAFDSKGNILVTGYTLSSDYPVTKDAMQRTYGGNADTFVAVVNPVNPFQSFLVYSTFLGGSHTEVGYDIAGDSAGNVYVTGYTLSPDFPTANAIQPAWASGIEIFVTKFRPGVAGLGALQYSTYLGLSSVYVPTAMAVGPDGTAYVVGYAGVGLASSPNAFQGGGFAGSTDGFLLVVSQ
jgi:hypothetical protein